MAGKLEELKTFLCTRTVEACGHNTVYHRITKVNVCAFYLTAVDKFQLGTKWWTDTVTFLVYVTCTAYKT